MRKLLTICFTFLCTGLFGQLNMSLEGYLDLASMHNSELSDIWGYVDTAGNEYAIVGLNNGTSIVDLSNPASPVEIFFEPGGNSTWRDMKTWGKFAYITTEADDGLLIIDLSSLPNATGISASYYYGPSGDTWDSAHNLFIDENGVAYIFGADRDNGGCIMLDVDSAPTNPIELGAIETWYTHDGVVRGDTLYMGHINDGFISIYDVSNKTSPVLLGTNSTPGNFSHNIWFSDDGNYAFTTDEITNGFIGSLDISNPANISIIDQIQSSPGEDVIPHNTHYWNGYIVTSYYRDGIVVHDVSDPSNIIEVGNYDTSPLSGDGFNGCWGAYPYLPSGLVLASDIELGLFVLNSNYTRGCYLHGQITEAGSGISISNAYIDVLATSVFENSDLTGNYKTGVGSAGAYDVHVSKPGYVPQTISGVSLTTGDTTILNVQLTPLVPFTISGTVMDNTNVGIPGATVVISNNDYLYTAVTGASGSFSITGVYQDTFNITVGQWGYITECYDDVYIDSTNNVLNYNLSNGYYDDFSLDFAWQSTSSATSGDWVRGEPNGTTFFGNPINPDEDVSGDCRGMAYVTGNIGGGAGNDDVDNGNVVLTSPVFDLTSYSFPYLRFYRWWVNGGGSSAGDDTVKFSITNGLTTVLLKELYGDDTTMMAWREETFMVDALITPTANMQFIVEASDWASGDGHLVEAGLGSIPDPGSP